MGWEWELSVLYFVPYLKQAYVSVKVLSVFAISLEEKHV